MMPATSHRWEWAFGKPREGAVVIFSDSRGCTMEISQIRYFVALVETGSMTKAAQHLYVTQPAVSAAVHRLEDELGVTLVERQGRGVRITIEGTQFYRRARNIINEYRAAKAETRPYSEGKPIRIGCLSTFPADGLSSFLSRLGDATPDHVVEFSEASPVVLDEWLRRGRIDVALTDLTHHKQAGLHTGVV
jgi:DNA-binding transcriptional LysR family regulator